MRRRSIAAGKTATFGFLVGQVMKAAAGKANPKRVNELLKRALESSELTLPPDRSELKPYL